MDKAQMTITEAIVMGNWDRSEIAKAYNLTEEEVAEMQIEHDRLMNDEDITEDEYSKWCDATDASNGTTDQLS